MTQLVCSSGYGKGFDNRHRRVDVRRACCKPGSRNGLPLLDKNSRAGRRRRRSVTVCSYCLAVAGGVSYRRLLLYRRQRLRGGRCCGRRLRVGRSGAVESRSRQATLRPHGCPSRWRRACRPLRPRRVRRRQRRRRSRRSRCRQGDIDAIITRVWFSYYLIIAIISHYYIFGTVQLANTGPPILQLTISISPILTRKSLIRLKSQVPARHTTALSL